MGVDWLYDEVNGGKFIAIAEKALCDKIRGDRGIGFGLVYCQWLQGRLNTSIGMT